MARLSIVSLIERFPNFRVAVVRASNLVIDEGRSPELQRMIDEAETSCGARWRGVELSAIPGVAAWRMAYRGFGIKKTSYRSSVERLLKRVLADGELPRINGLVDIYNGVSLSYCLCLGADDIDLTSGDLAFRFSRPGDSFLDMSAEAGEDPNDPPKDGEVVYADEDHVLCRRWNWRQDARSVVTTATKNAVLTIQSNGFGDVAAAAGALVRAIAAECRGRCSFAVADRAAPIVEF
ncbi:MAG TPA: phenylalanine--tRNA ligase beta subunit-related protein [Roseiarcus sp.]|nr:phenylalanine--tRNA ligase beta subunit-related protein [Roseiarcus sp.]